MSQDDNPWSPAYVPPLRPEDVPPPPGWGGPGGPAGQGHGWSPYPEPPRRSRLPGSLAGMATMSAIGAWGTMLCLVSGAEITRAMDRASGAEQFAFGWLAFLGLVFVASLGLTFGALAVVGAVVAIPLAAVFFGERRRSIGVTGCLAHAGVAWLVLLLTGWQVLW